MKPKIQKISAEKANQDLFGVANECSNKAGTTRALADRGLYACLRSPALVTINGQPPNHSRTNSYQFPDTTALGQQNTVRWSITPNRIRFPEATNNYNRTVPSAFSKLGDLDQAHEVISRQKLSQLKRHSTHMTSHADNRLKLALGHPTEPKGLQDHLQTQKKGGATGIPGLQGFGYQGTQQNYKSILSHKAVFQKQAALPSSSRSMLQQEPLPPDAKEKKQMNTAFQTAPLRPPHELDQIVLDRLNEKICRQRSIKQVGFEYQAFSRDKRHRFGSLGCAASTLAEDPNKKVKVFRPLQIVAAPTSLQGTTLSGHATSFANQGAPHARHLENQGSNIFKQHKNSTALLAQRVKPVKQAIGPKRSHTPCMNAHSQNRQQALESAAEQLPLAVNTKLLHHPIIQHKAYQTIPGGKPLSPRKLTEALFTPLGDAPPSRQFNGLMQLFEQELEIRHSLSRTRPSSPRSLSQMLSSRSEPKEAPHAKQIESKPVEAKPSYLLAKAETKAQDTKIAKLLRDAEARLDKTPRRNSNKNCSERGSQASIRSTHSIADNSINGEDDQLAQLKLFEAFRTIFWRVGFQMGLPEKQVRKLHAKPNGPFAIFAYLSTVHLVQRHGEADAAAVDLEAAQPQPAEGIESPRLSRTHTLDSVRLKGETALSGSTVRRSLSEVHLIAPVLEEDEEGREATAALDDEQGSQSNLQFKEMNQSEKTQMVVGVSMGAAKRLVGQSTDSMAMKRETTLDSDYTPRVPHTSSKQRSVGKLASIKQSSGAFKKDTRKAKPNITASQLMEQSKTGRNHLSIDQIPQTVPRQGGRNHNLSNSLQMIASQEPTARNNISNSSNAQQQSNFQALNLPFNKTVDKSFHLRYVSQGLQRSQSIESSVVPGRPSEPHKRSSLKSSQVQRQNLNFSVNSQSKDKILVINSKNASAPQEKAGRATAQQSFTVSAFDKNMAPATGPSKRQVVRMSPAQQPGASGQGRLVGGKQAPSQSVLAGSNPDTQLEVMQRSLNVNSIENSLVVDKSTPLTQERKPDGPFVFQTTEYGSVNKQDQQRQSDQIKLSSEEFEFKKKAQSAVMPAASAERKNVPLRVSKRKTMLPSGFSIHEAAQDKAGQPIKTGGDRVSTINMSQKGSTQNSSSLQNAQTVGPVSQNVLPSNPLFSDQANPNNQSMNGFSGAQAHDIARTRISSTSSNQFFSQSNMAVPQPGALQPAAQAQLQGQNSSFMKPNIERALRTAQQGGSQRTRAQNLDQSYNIWDMPLNMKFEFSRSGQSDVLISQQRKEKNKSQKGQQADQQLVLLHNMTPGMGKKPDFRQSTALPKSYKQFVATVNSGLPIKQPAGGTAPTNLVQPQSQMQQLAPANRTFTSSQKDDRALLYSSNQAASKLGASVDLSDQKKQEIYTQALQAQNMEFASFTGKKSRRSRKDEVFRMISKLEFGENSETFRAMAKQFYVKNVQQLNASADNPNLRSKRKLEKSPNLTKLEKGPSQVATQDSTQLVSASGSRPTTIQNKQLPSQQQLGSKQKGSGKEQQPSPDSVDIIAMQKQLWQQFQLLRILKQTKYQHQVAKYSNRGSSFHVEGGPPGSQALEYGFELTEEEMYERLFKDSTTKPIMGNQLSASLAQQQKDKSQPYASFDCPECVQMASLMLDEELRFYMQRSTNKRSQRNLRGKDAAAMRQSKSGHAKGIAGIQTHGVSLNQFKMGDSIDANNYTSVFNNSVQDANIFTKTQNGSKRARAQTQQQNGARKNQVMTPEDATQLMGQIFISRAQPQIFFKKQLNQSFKQVIRGEQMTQHFKQQAMAHAGQSAQAFMCQCGALQQAQLGGRPKPCICPMRPTSDEFSQQIVFSAQSMHPQQKHQLKKQGCAGKNPIGKISAAHMLPVREGSHHVAGSSAEPHAHGVSHHPALDHKAVLDGTVHGYKRKYKPANGIYQSPLQPFKHLQQSIVNQTITKVNELVLVLFKQKMKSSDQQLIKLLKYFQVPIPRGNGIQLDMKQIKAPDFLHLVNQKMLMRLYKVINHENNGVKPEQSTQLFRFYVGKGNNYPSVRQIISRRTWWNRGSQRQEKFYGQGAGALDFADSFVGQGALGGAGGDEQLMLSNKQFASGCHFIWTQWRKTEHHEYLKKVSLEKQRLRAALERASGKVSPKGTRKHQGRPKVKSTSSEEVARLLKSAGGLSQVPTLIYNRLDDNYHLSNKKALFLNISTYYQAMGINPFEVAIPLTFNVKHPNASDSEFLKFTRAYKAFESQKDENIWIIKPGENSNRGTGIQVASSFSEIRSIVQSQSAKNGNRTAIVQKYIERPLLINNRKFDIRGYAMLTSINGAMKGYMYRDCYFRTSSKQFDLSNLHSRFIHLTNDAIQMNSEDYGRYESGNKLSINDFQRYLDAHHASKNVCFMRDLFPQMERLVTDSFRAVGSKIDPARISNCFEIFGYDFMIDENFKVFLIEANTNPCLEICSPLLARIIPELLDNSFRVAIDPLFQPSQFLAKLKDEHGAKESAAPGDKAGDPSKDFANSATTTLGPKHVAEGSGKEGGAEPSAITTVHTTQSPTKRTSTGKDLAMGGSGHSHNTPNQLALKRQRLELIPQIKYTLIYDERIDKPVVDQILADYAARQKQPVSSAMDSQTAAGMCAESEQAKSMEIKGESTAVDSNEVTSSASLANGPEQHQLFKEIVEEEKLDEQAAKKEEIEAAENEEAGIMPQPMMLMQPLAQQAVPASDEDEENDEELESEEDFFH